MKKIALICVILSLTLSGCNGKKATDAVAETDTTTVTEELVSGTDEFKLIEVKGEKIGFTIQIPQGAKELQNNEYSWTYSLVFPDGMNEINVNVVKVVGEINSIEDAVNYTSSGGGAKGAKEQKTVGSDFLVVKLPTGTILQEFWYFAKAKEGFIAVKCTAPPSQETVCLAIVNSLKAI